MSFNSLCYDIISSIFCFLDTITLIKCQTVNKSIYQIALQNTTNFIHITQKHKLSDNILQK